MSLQGPLPFRRDTLDYYKTLLQKCGSLPCRVVSNSMEPLIQAGDMIRVKPMRAVSELKTFNILVFLEHDRLVCHYLWNVSVLAKEDTLITRSLRSSHEGDYPVKFSNVLGMVADVQIPLTLKLRILFRNKWFGTS